MRLLLTCFALLSLALLGWTALACASMLVQQSPEQLGTQSDVVVLGRVEGSQSYWNDQHTKVYTRVRIAVDQTYKGTPGTRLELVQLGGTVGPLQVTAHGAPTWRVGEEVLVFAERGKAGEFRVSGFSQGKFGIVRDARTGEARVLAPRVESTRLLGGPSNAAAREAGPGVPLDEFIDHALGRTWGQGVDR
jgi:hypothetical protein